MTDGSQAEDKVIKNVADLSQKELMASRLRQAWVASKEAAATGAVKKKQAVAEQDLDTLIDASDLKRMAERFWGRYKLRYDLDSKPSDYLVSRLYKEFSTRMLQVHPVFKVKTLSHQLMQEKKRRKLGDCIEIIETQGSSVKIRESMHSYLELHFTLMLGFALAGIERVPSAPPPDTEDASKCSTQYVQAPFDLLMRYHSRLRKAAAAMGSSKDILAWVRRKDEEERQLWVEKHRSTILTVGQVILAVFNQRANLWEVPEHIDQGKAFSSSSASGDEQPRAGNPVRKKRKKNKATAGGKGQRQQQQNQTQPDNRQQQTGKRKAKALDSMRSGKEICRQYNLGKCKDPCKRGFLHCCNLELPGKPGVACGKRVPAVDCKDCH